MRRLGPRIAARVSLRGEAARPPRGPTTARLGRWHNVSERPVLKHGPRSLTRARVFGCFKPERAAKTKVETSVAEGTDARTRASREGSAVERARWDPKDGELCLNRAKPEETLVEARSGSDVQIDRQIWV